MDEARRRLQENPECAKIFGGEKKALKRLAELKFKFGSLDNGGIAEINGLEAAGMTLEPVPDESQFVELKPGELYSLDRVFNFHIRTAGYDHGSLRVGKNVLEMVVLTWYYPRASNVKWRDRWQNKGYLWSDPLTSVAMPFMVEKKPPLVDCR